MIKPGIYIELIKMKVMMELNIIMKVNIEIIKIK